MRRSLARYLLLNGVLALVVNVVINALVGNAVYGHMRAVPLTGQTSITGDTIVGAFLIAFFTVLVVAPAARREVRSGRVAGGKRIRLTDGPSGPSGPSQQSRSSWSERHPFMLAVVAGLASALSIGGGTVAILAASGLAGSGVSGSGLAAGLAGSGVPASGVAAGGAAGSAVAAMSVGAFLAFKVAFAGAWGTLAAVGTAALVVAREPDVPADDRWSRDAGAPPVYPFDYIDKGGLAVTSARHGCSGTPTWQLVVRGMLDPAAVRAALADIVVRYPVLGTRVQSRDAIPEYAKHFRYAGAPTEIPFEVVDLRGRPASELAALIRDVWNRQLDQFREPQVSLTMAITADDACHLLFRQHHGIADGRAFIGLLTDFARFVAAHESGSAPRNIEPVPRRTELEALQLSAARRAWFAIAGFGSLVRSIAKALVRPTSVLVPNESADYTGANGAIRWVVDETALDGWKSARKRLDASQSDLLLAALFLATQRWHHAMGRRLGRVNASMVMETRPRDGSFVSFANHLATLECELRLDRSSARELDPAAAIRSIHAQLKRQLDSRRPIKRLVCERAIVLGMPLDKLHAFVFDAKRPAFNLNLSNLIPLDFPVMAGRGWTVDEVLITTPVTPRNGIVLTVVRYNGRVCFNFNYTESAATAAQTREFAQLYREALETITGFRPTEPATTALDTINA